MGMRSQIYVAVKDIDVRNEHGDNLHGDYLVARYYQWNYGSRMVSRAVGLIEWLETTTAEYIEYELNKIARIADTNFDFRDVAISTDCIKEFEEYGNDPFYEQDNNDGKLFITFEKDGTVKYAFTDPDIEKVMTAAQYMAWGEYETEEKDGSNYIRKNREFLNKHQLMTLDEVKEFIAADYVNVPKETEREKGKKKDDMER